MKGKLWSIGLTLVLLVVSVKAYTAIERAATAGGPTVPYEAL
jgi:hypothetical protein